LNEKYRPWLAKSERLYQAMDTVDRSAGKKRGLLLIEERVCVPPFDIRPIGR
jgi:hypothetical protein